jgi:ABC-type transport system involved in multi-copper enzyme maturation permease subunit
MNGRVFRHTLWLGRTGLVWYLVGALLAVATGGLGLSVISGQRATLTSFLDQLPPAVLAAFKISGASFATPIGYMAARSLSLLWPLLMLAFVAGSAGGVSSLLERGTIHFELSLPVSRTRWFLSRVLTGVVGVLLIVLVTWAALSAFIAAPWWRFALLGLAFGFLWLGIAYAAAAFLRDRSVVMGVVFGLFAAQFLLATLSSVVSGASWLADWNLWSAYQPESVVNGGVPWGTLGVWVLLGGLGLALGVWRWKERDLPA